MKKFSALISALFLVAAVSLIGCEKEQPPMPPPAPKPAVKRPPAPAPTPEPAPMPAPEKPAKK